MDEVRAPAVRGCIRDSRFRRLSHGLFLLDEGDSTDEEAFLEELAAWRLVMPEDAVFTHVTAARLLGWWLPIIPIGCPVFMATAEATNGTRRAGLVVSRLGTRAGAGSARDLPVDRAEEIVLRAARDLSELDLLVMVVSAVRLGHVDVPALEELCAKSPRPGVARLRSVLGLVDPGYQSPMEVLFGVFHVTVGLEVDVQAPLERDDGIIVGHGDLLIRGTVNVQEIDGGVHLARSQQIKDRRRERGIAATRYIRRGYTSSDILGHPLVVLAEIDKFLGRRHHARRADRWRALVARSTYSEAGLQRLHNRWRGTLFLRTSVGRA